jgi:hypothetical protein
MGQYVQLPDNSKIDVRPLRESGIDVHRERVEIATSAPATSVVSVATIAAGGQATLNSAVVPAGYRGRLAQVLVASSVAFKAVVQSVVADVETTRAIWIETRRGWDFRPPTMDFLTVLAAGGGFDGFRVVVTNLSPAETADCYATFFVDVEEPA